MKAKIIESTSLVKALNGFLMTQRHMTLGDECGYRTLVSKLHRPRLLDAFFFLADALDTTRL